MSSAEIRTEIEALLPVLSGDQLQAIADVARALVRTIPTESDATRRAIAEGLTEADRGDYVDLDTVDELQRPWA